MGSHASLADHLPESNQTVKARSFSSSDIFKNKETPSSDKPDPRKHLTLRNTLTQQFLSGVPNPTAYENTLSLVLVDNVNKYHEIEEKVYFDVLKLVFSSEEGKPNLEKTRALLNDLNDLKPELLGHLRDQGSIITKFYLLKDIQESPDKIKTIKLYNQTYDFFAPKGAKHLENALEYLVSDRYNLSLSSREQFLSLFSSTMTTDQIMSILKAIGTYIDHSLSSMWEKGEEDDTELLQGYGQVIDRTSEEVSTILDDEKRAKKIISSFKSSTPE